MVEINSLVDCYKNSVEEADKKGYADTYKKAMELVVSKIAEDDQTPFHIEDVKYQDGYYIFGTGTNSIAHFHIKEIPGFLFGIWWNEPKVDEDKNRTVVPGEMFAQYEDNIDKFKPSRSEFCWNISAVFYTQFEDDINGRYMLLQELKFMANEPYLAFCRDYCGWNYNSEYHTRAEAKKTYDKYLTFKANKEKYTKENDELVLAFIKDKVLPLYNNSYIYDCGENWSPRYEVVAPLKDNLDKGVEEHGLYDLFDESVQEEKAVKKEWKALLKRCNSVANKYKFWWSNPASDCILFKGDENESC